MKKTELMIWTILCSFILFFTGCGKTEDEALSPEMKFQAFCGSCHSTPDPKHVSKSFWENNVLPEMAARLGYKYNGYDPLAKNSMEENLYVKNSKIYPETKGIDSASWQQIHDYIIGLAPESIPVDTLRTIRNTSLTISSASRT